MQGGLLSWPRFIVGVQRLEAAFRTQTLSDNALKLYYEKIGDVVEADYLNAVEAIIEAEDFFPSISKLRKYCGIEGIYDAAGRRLSY